MKYINIMRSNGNTQVNETRLQFNQRLYRKRFASSKFRKAFMLARRNKAI